MARPGNGVRTLCGLMVLPWPRLARIHGPVGNQAAGDARRSEAKVRDGRARGWGGGLPCAATDRSAGPCLLLQSWRGCARRT